MMKGMIRLVSEYRDEHKGCGRFSIEYDQSGLGGSLLKIPDIEESIFKWDRLITNFDE
jgi:hypothetical protein